MSTHLLMPHFCVDGGMELHGAQSSPFSMECPRGPVVRLRECERACMTALCAIRALPMWGQRGDKHVAEQHVHHRPDQCIRGPACINPIPIKRSITAAMQHARVSSRLHALILTQAAASGGDGDAAPPGGGGGGGGDEGQSQPRAVREVTYMRRIGLPSPSLEPKP